MKLQFRRWQLFSWICWLVIAQLPAQAADPLPSWNAGTTKSAITAFVTRVTDPASPDYVPVADRIATFDNDGTLWSEQPFYFQLAFAIDRVRALAAKHPEWKAKPVFQKAIAGDYAGVLSQGKSGLLELVMASHAGMTTDEFQQDVQDWIRTARHPRFNRPYTDLVYQPMLELLDYLRANGFQVWIVSGGGVEFMRAWAPRVYGVNAEHIIGSSIKTEFQIRDGKPILLRLPEIDFIDDGPEKPVGIHKFVGRRPIAAFGNSDGDLQMLQWTAGGDGARLMLLVHHTDGKREWAYDRDSHIGQLDKGLSEAATNAWTVVNMQRDWNVMYPFQRDDHHYFHKSEKSHVAEWSYSGPTGPEYWGELSPQYRLAKNGRRQSPIDIRDAEHRDLPAVKFKYKPSRIRLVYNGHTVQENEDAGSFAVANEQDYALEQFHFHSPSEHTVNGRQYPMEMHLVHKTENGSVGVVAVFIEEGESNPAFDVVWKYLPNQQQQTQNAAVTVNATDLLPTTHDYFTYSGSFTTPPCTEHVKWLVLSQPVQLSKQQIERFRQVIDGNNRPIQPRHGREVELSK